MGEVKAAGGLSLSLMVTDTLGTIAFNSGLIAVTLPPWLLCKLGRFVLSEDTLRSLVLQVTCLEWRLGLWFSSPWVQIRSEGIEETRKIMNARAGKPRMLISNHSSFLDTIMAVACTGVPTMPDVRMLVSKHLTKMPILRTLVKTMGHFIVPFKESNNKDLDNFSVDKDEMAAVNKQAEDWLSGGHVLAYFPEGRMNPGCAAKLQMFRAGGFSNAVRYDVDIFALVLLGNDVCWPRDAPIGGRPCHIRAKMFRICESSHELLANCGADNDRDKSIYLANYAQTKMQEVLDEWVEEGWASIKADKKVD